MHVNQTKTKDEEVLWGASKGKHQPTHLTTSQVKLPFLKKEKNIN